MPRSDRAISSTATRKPWREDLHEGWEGVSAADVRVTDFSGYGGGKAYKLTNASRRAAPAVALHVLHESQCPAPADPIFFDRQKRAHGLFVEAGLSPRRLCEDPGHEWFAEEWVGETGAREEVTVELVEELGRLVARVHSIPTEWYDEIRARQRERHPALADAPEGSHIWWAAAIAHHCLDPFGEDIQRAWIATGPTPATEAGARIVTCHGDVHRANVARTAEGLRFIDLDIACVTYAIQDLAFCIGLVCETGKLADAFIRAYLQACDLPASSQDVFALRLDVERCRMATNFYDTNALLGFVDECKDRGDLGDVYPRLVAIADRALVERSLAEEIVAGGFEQCAAVRDAQRDAGKPLLGMVVTVHRDLPAPVERSQFVINWDGTVQSSWELHRGAVLGLDDRGQVILTNCLNADQRLQLRMEGGIPVTGKRRPTSAPVPLVLSGPDAGQALVLAANKDQGWGNDVEFVRLGPVEDALLVHVEADGVIRLAREPHQSFDCARGWTSSGASVLIFHNHCSDGQRFALNDDATLSPIGNRDVVWGMRGDDLILVGRDDERSGRLTFDEGVVAAAHAPGPGTLVEGEPPACDAGYVLDLASHPQMALSVMPDEEREDLHHLVVVPVAGAERFCVAADRLRPVRAGGRIATGTPMPKD